MSLRDQLQKTTKRNSQVGLKVAELIEEIKKASDNGEHMYIEYLESVDSYNHQEFWHEDNLKEIQTILAGDEYKLDMSFRTDDEDDYGRPIWRIMIDWM